MARTLTRSLLARAAGIVDLLAEAVPRSYAQLLLVRSRTVGALLIAATATSPRLLLAGLAGVTLACLTARGLSLRDDLVRSGLFGYNALLLALGGATFFSPTPLAVALTMLMVMASVLVTAAAHSALGTHFNLPTLTLPFLVLFPLLFAAAKLLGMPSALLAAPTATGVLGQLPPSVRLLLQSLGAIVFLPRLDAGLWVAFALLVGTRVGALLAVIGFAVACLFAAHVRPGAPMLLPMVLGYNGLLTAIALGGVWFVPSWASLLLGAMGSLLAAVLGVGLLAHFSVGGLPLLVLPFNLVVVLVLYAMRQRIRDRHPKAVDFLVGTPEQNLSHLRSRLSRFGSSYGVRFTAPFLGRWTCTQGHDGEHTHRGPWRYAFDFEVDDQDGSRHEGHGTELSDFYCYRLPVLAAADGTVARVVDGVPDNEPGKVNLEQNWGNAVVLYHAPGLYSLVCHLAPGTLEVRVGQTVRRGDRLGLCGASGRAPTPHLHFQLQATDRLGAPTLHAELQDVIKEGQQAELFASLAPQKGDRIRNISPDEELIQLFALPYGSELALKDAQGRAESAAVEIDAIGGTLLQSEQAALYFDNDGRCFTVYDVLGSQWSMLAAMRLALARVPLESDVLWRDTVSQRQLLGWWRRLANDFVAPFTRGDQLQLSYRMQRQGAAWWIRGESTARRRGVPLLSTEARLTSAHGLVELSIRYRGKSRSYRRADASEQRAAASLQNNVSLVDVRRLP